MAVGGPPIPAKDMLGTACAARAGTEGGRRDRFSGWALAATTAAIVLAPYATVTLPFRASLAAQAAAILFFTLLLACVGLATNGWFERLRRLDRATVLGLGLYLATAVMATLVGLVRGNELALVAGQTLSMGLLPLGAFAAASLPTTRQISTFSPALVTATTVAALVHFGAWARMLGTDRPQIRFYLNNSVSAVGVSLLAILLALALSNVLRGARRGLARLAAAVIFVFVVGSGTRSLWIALLVGLLILATASGAWRTLTRTRAMLALGVTLCVLGAALAGVAAWWRHPRQNRLPDTSFAAPFWTLPPDQTAAVLDPVSPGTPTLLEWKRTVHAHSAAVSAPLRLEGERTYRLSASMQGAHGVRCAVSFALSRGERLPSTWVVLEAVSPTRRTPVRRTFPTPEGPLTGYVVVTAEEFASQPCRATDLLLEDLGPAALFSLELQADHLARRWRDLPDSITTGSAAKDDNVALRYRENEVLLEHFASSSAIDKTLGHGLGARFRLRTLTWIAEGRSEWVETPNYIHNFYAFLLYKTGVMGLSATLAALALWLLALVRVRQTATDRKRRALWAAAFAALGAYALWSLVCPEILDFRVAPLWGLLLGASGAIQGSSERTPIAGGSRREADTA